MKEYTSPGGGLLIIKRPLTEDEHKQTYDYFASLGMVKEPYTPGRDIVINVEVEDGKTQ